jgi:hypothetical protein
MSIGLLLTVLAANAAATASRQPGQTGYVQLSSAALAAESTAMSQYNPTLLHAVSDDRPDHPAGRDPDVRTSVDLAVYVGNRHSAQLELGVLGGGRADAPSLAHVGFGFDF